MSISDDTTRPVAATPAATLIQIAVCFFFGCGSAGAQA
jgi:hypothetical protein